MLLAEVPVADVDSSQRDFMVTEPNGWFCQYSNVWRFSVRAVKRAVSLSLPQHFSLRWVRVILVVGVANGVGPRGVCRFVRHVGCYVHPVASPK